MPQRILSQLDQPRPLPAAARDWRYRGRRLALVLGSIVAIAGCSSMKWPWSKSPPATAAAQAGASGQVQQASFDQNPAGAKTAVPGASLDGVADERPWLHRVGDNLKGESIHKKYKQAVGRSPNEQVAREAYAEGEKLFKEKNYVEAAKKFAVAADRWPDSQLEEDATFWRAESLFFADKYVKAADLYGEVLKKNPSSRYLETIVTREFAIARYWDAESMDRYWFQLNLTNKKLPIFDTYGNAVGMYEAVRMQDPTGPVADDAVFANGTSQFVRGRYDEASEAFETLRKEHASSPFVTKASLLEIRSKLRTYQGSEYDAGPLTRADKLITSTLDNFGSQIPEERERLQRAHRAIREHLAVRDYNHGEYYYRRKCYGAARYYYAAVLKQFPDTQVAQSAQERLEETKDYPPDPPDRWGWLGKIFGERPRVQ